MRSQRKLKFGHWVGLLALLTLLVGAVPSTAQAGPYTRLQVLLPGETAAPGTLTGKTGTPQAQVIGVPFTVVMQACDEDWHVVTSVTNLVQWNSADGQASLPEAFPLSGGVATASATFHTRGTFTISGQDLSDPAIAEAYSADVVSVHVAGFEFEGFSGSPRPVGSPMNVEIRVVDTDGYTVGGFTGPINLQQFTSFGMGRLSPEVVNFNHGQWSGQLTMYRADETTAEGGGVNIHAYLPADPNVSGTSVSFDGTPAELKRIQIILPGQTPAPGSIAGLSGVPASQAANQAFTVDVRSTDDYWNPVPASTSVRLTSSDPQASTPVFATLAGGTAQVSLQLGTVGAQTLTVFAENAPSLSGMISDPITVTGTYADGFVFDDLPEFVTAGVAFPVTIRATSGGTVNPGFNGDTILSANTGAASMSPSQVTFVNGIATLEMELYGAGPEVRVTCSDYSAPPHLGTSDPIQVLPSAYVATQVILPGQTPEGGTVDGIAGTPDPQNAGQMFVLQVRAVDQYFNRVYTIDDPVTVHSVDSFMDVPESIAFVDGEALIPVTIYRAGDQTVSVSDDLSSGIDTPASSTFNVAPGSYTQLLMLAPGEENLPGHEDGRIGTPTNQSVTYQFMVTVMATDPWFNQVQGVGDVVQLTCTDPGAELAPDTALIDGKALLGVRLVTNGWQLITLTSVSSPSIPLSMTQVKAISSGLHLLAEISTDAVQAGVPFSLSVRMVNDVGTLIQENHSAIQVRALNANTGEVGRGELTPTTLVLEQGLLTATMTYTYPEPIVLEISDNDGSTPGVTTALAVEPGAPEHINLNSDPGWVRANQTAVISARVTDAFDNPVPGQSVTFATAAGDSGTLVVNGNKIYDNKAQDKSVVSLTNANGIAQVNYHSPREAQVIQVMAGVDALLAEYELETALIDPSSAGGTITNYPNPFHPDETATTIAYVLDDNASVRLRVYSISGSLVLDRQHAAGDVGGSTGLNEITWDGRNGMGEPVASGGYIAYVEAEGNGATQHVMRRKIGVVW